jgi:hypothetical protein
VACRDIRVEVSEHPDKERFVGVGPLIQLPSKGSAARLLFRAESGTNHTLKKFFGVLVSLLAI